MRTQEEIVKRFEERKSKDLLCFEVNEYIPYLDYEHAKPYLNKKSVYEEEWKPFLFDEIIERMKEYMPFAWRKANDCRGISANRSVMHYIAWIWLSGDSTFATEIDHQLEYDYYHYGKPILVQICNHYKWDWKQWDNGIRTNTEH